MVYFPGWGRSDWDNLSAVNPRTGRVRPWDQLKRPYGPTGNFRPPSQPKGGIPLGQAISGLLPPISTPTKEPGSPAIGGVPRTYSGGGGIPTFYEPQISPTGGGPTMTTANLAPPPADYPRIRYPDLPRDSIRDEYPITNPVVRPLPPWMLPEFPPPITNPVEKPFPPGYFDSPVNFREWPLDHPVVPPEGVPKPGTWGWDLWIRYLSSFLPKGVSYPGGSPWFNESTGRFIWGDLKPGDLIPVPGKSIPKRFLEPPGEGGGQTQPQPLPQPPGDTWLNPLPLPTPPRRDLNRLVWEDLYGHRLIPGKEGPDALEMRKEHERTTKKALDDFKKWAIFQSTWVGRTGGAWPWEFILGPEGSIRDELTAMLKGEKELSRGYKQMFSNLWSLFNRLRNRGELQIKRDDASELLKEIERFHSDRSLYSSLVRKHPFFATFADMLGEKLPDPNKVFVEVPKDSDPLGMDTWLTTMFNYRDYLKSIGKL